MGEVFLVRERLLKPVRRAQGGPIRAGVEAVEHQAVSERSPDHRPAAAPGRDPGVRARRAPGRPALLHDAGDKGRTLKDLVTSVHAASTDGQWAPDENGWTLRRLVEVFHRACETVAYAHHRFVVHRDLKPSNIMAGDFGEVLVLDWGLAKLVGGDRDEDGPAEHDAIQVTERHDTKSGVVAGTPAYMAPEQSRGEHDLVGPATDVYALGAVLYEILRNRPPFAASEASTHVGTVAKQAVKGQRPALDFPDAPPVPQELQVICARALELEAKERYPDAGVLAAEVSAWLEGAKNLAVAKSFLADAQQRHAEVLALRESARLGREKARQILSEIPGFAPVDAKKEGWAVEDGAEDGSEKRTSRRSPLRSWCRRPSPITPISPKRTPCSPRTTRKSTPGWKQRVTPPRRPDWRPCCEITTAAAMRRI
jgi:serine/threonine protein kinase